MKLLKNIKIYGLVLLMVALLPSCIYETLEEPENYDMPTEEAGYYLSLLVNLESMTRASEFSNDFEKYEDYIDADNLRVLFFYDDADRGKQTLMRQFKSGDMSLIPVRNSSDQSLKSWYLRIPVKEGNESFADSLRKRDFKIAVLANWPSSTPDLRPGDSIQMLHHLYADGTYTGEPYVFLTEGTNKMGMFTRWIEDAWSSKDAAYNWIKENWDPSKKSSYKDYEDLRLLWNFQGAAEKDSEKYDSFGEKWAEKNFKDLGAWLNKGGNLTNDTVKNSDNGNFIFVANGDKDAEGGATYGYATDASGNELTTGPKGIILPEYDGPNKETDNINKNVIKLTLPASGKLNIKWGSADGETAKIMLHLRNHLDDSTPSETKSPSGSTDAIAKDINNYEFTINGDSEYLYIFSQKGNVIIYEIEYTQGKYLYESDRSGIPLREDYLIPMYGVQNYKAIGDIWEYGTVFDLSNFNNINQGYECKDISLLRSVAKVEIKIPASLEPHHVFLRSANRQARCEPMDVSTPTDSIWRDHADDLEHSKRCEFFNITGHTPFYVPTQTADSASQMANYKSKLAWYYGSWGDGATVGGVTIDKAGDTGDFPRIFNPRISRSDFTEFIPMGESDGIYKRYVLYVPEKFVDDPNSLTDLNGIEVSNPKVCHIEFRTGEYPHTNLDDNGCYRIYFTENGFNNDLIPNFSNKTSDGTSETWENHYERDVDNLKTHWPIMRNHLYSFTVVDANNRVAVVKLEVLPWRMIEENNSYNW